MNLDKSKEFKEIIKKAKKDKNIIALILFGSYAKKTQKPNSDIDICIIGKKNKLLHEFFEILEYQSKEFDILLYNNLPDYIKFRVYSEGKILVINDDIFYNIRHNFLHRFRDEYNFYQKQLEKVAANV